MPNLRGLWRQTTFWRIETCFSLVFLADSGSIWMLKLEISRLGKPKRKKMYCKYLQIQINILKIRVKYRSTFLNRVANIVVF